MRGSAALLVLFASSLSVAAPAGELVFPSRTPKIRLSQRVGLTDITVAYESPALGGRKLVGSIVKPGALWLMADREAPTITFSRDVVLRGATVPAGTYSLLAVQGANEWTVVLNRQPRIWRPAERDQRLDVASVKVAADAVPQRERLVFVFSDFTEQRVTLDLEWEKVRLRIPIDLQTDAQVAAQLRALDEGWRRYAEAAWYSLRKGTDLPAGLRYADQSIALRETWYNVWLKASLLAAEGDYTGARDQADRALQLGRAAGNEFTLAGEIDQSRAEWSNRSTGQPKVAASRSAHGVRTGGRVAQAALQSSDATIGDAGAVADEPGVERSVQVLRPAAVKPPSQEALGPLIKRGVPDLRLCYQRALREDPSLVKARITLSISVGVSGRVSSVSVDPPATGTLEACLRSAVNRWPFPESPVQYDMEVPLALRGRQ